MQAFTGEILADPIYGLIAAGVLFGALGLGTIHISARKRDAANPLGGLFDASTFDSQLQTIAQRSAKLPPRPISRPAPPLHGQRAQFARLREVWEHDTREELIEQVARVMRASKDAKSAPVNIVKADPVFEAIEWQAEWEEVKLLPPPASQAA